MQKRIDIQLLRAIAVIFVVMFHLEIAGVESGFLGVDVFFVVSGFLMAILYKKGETKKFFERRAKRLLPAYFTTLVLESLNLSLRQYFKFKPILIHSPQSRAFFYAQN